MYLVEISGYKCFSVGCYVILEVSKTVDFPFSAGCALSRHV